MAHDQKRARVAEASLRREARDKGREEKAASKFNGECRYCQKKGHKKVDCRKMKADIDAGRCGKNGKPKGVNALTAAGSTQPSPQESYAPSLSSSIPLQQVVPMCCSQTPHPGSSTRSCRPRRLLWLQAWTEQNTRYWILDQA